MKYIYYILLIVLAVSLLVGLELFLPLPDDDKPALVINGYTLSREEYLEMYKERPPYLVEEKEFIGSLITRNLLIQEAKNRGIDQRESFRKSIQNYYEQSLIKTLLDEKMKSLDIEVGEEEIDRYLEMYNRNFIFTIFHYDDPEAAEEDRPAWEEQTTLPYARISSEARCRLLGLEEGERSKPFPSGEGMMAYRLDRIGPLPDSAPAQAPDRERARATLKDYKISRAIDEWTARLRQEAHIENHLNQSGAGAVSK